MDDIDRISNLPDDLLFHILSFLHTEDVFATSLVSKRWIPLWFSVPSLYFDEYRYTTPPGSTRLVRFHPSFIKFVDASIFRRGIHQPIKTFYLECSLCPVFQVEKWLKTAADCKVENLQFTSWATGQDFPCTIFSIKTLVVLKLRCVDFREFSSVELPSLKTLHLDHVRFLMSGEHFIDLLNGCPLLETLEAKHVIFDFADDPSSERKTKFTTSSKLVRADVVNVWSSDFDIPVRTFCNVEFLRIHTFCDVDIPIFPNLIRLELIIGRDLNWESVLDMLNHCPQLQTFLLENTSVKFWPETVKVWPKTPVVVPACFSSHLQTCIITKFVGAECEMTFAKFVMQNSTLLRTMTISTHTDPYLSPSHEQKAEMRKELESCPRSNATCELLFEYFF